MVPGRRRREVVTGEDESAPVPCEMRCDAQLPQSSNYLYLYLYTMRPIPAHRSQELRLTMSNSIGVSSASRRNSPPTISASTLSGGRAMRFGNM